MAVGDVMLHWLRVAFSTYVLHPLRGSGYQWWSGAGSDLGEATLVGAVIATARHKNCHHRHCLRFGHAHPEHGWPSCKRHWREVPEHAR